jgi:hypothetical protein
VHPGQDARVFEGGNRDADAVAVTLRGGGYALVRREAAPATIGIVEAPQERAEHAQGGPRQWTLVLPRLAISRVVGARRGPHAGFGVAVERMGGCRSKDLVAARPQSLPRTRSGVIRQSNTHGFLSGWQNPAGSGRAKLGAACAADKLPLSAEIPALQTGSISGNVATATSRYSSASSRSTARPSGGLGCFWSLQSFQNG